MPGNPALFTSRNEIFGAMLRVEAANLRSNISLGRAHGALLMLMIAGLSPRRLPRALKTEFGLRPSALKQVAHLTGANERTVRNWFEGKNGPSGEGLVSLVRNSHSMLQVVLTLSGREHIAAGMLLSVLREQLAPQWRPWMRRSRPRAERGQLGRSAASDRNPPPIPEALVGD